MPQKGGKMSKKSEPRWKINQAIQIGKEALMLVKGREKDIVPRLSAGLLEGLKADLDELEALLTGRPSKTTEVKGLTGTEKEISEKGAEWVSGIREAVKRRAEKSGLIKAVGVGEKLKKEQSKSVVIAIEAILTAAKEKADEMRACGILESDILKGTAILNSLMGARRVQEEGIKTKKDLTTKKNIVQIRIENAIDEICTAGYLQYIDKDKVLAERFRDLIPSSPKKKKSKEEEKPVQKDKT